MFKMMIVDDEMMVRIGLSSIIEWEKLNCCILSEAVDGIEALEKIRQDPPDIVITDIRMPGMDGLELARHISEEFPNIKVIILTGYADFEYAQSAIKYGVIDFVLKPTEIESIESAVSKAVKSLESEINKNRLVEDLNSTINSQLPNMREKLICDCINLIITDASEISKSMEQLTMESKPFYMVLGELEDDVLEIRNNQAGSCQPKNIILKNIMDMSFKDFTHWCAVLDESHCCTVVLSQSQSLAEDIQKILAACHDITDIFESSYDLHVTLGISDRVQTPGAFRMAYEQSVSALSYTLQDGNRINLYVRNFSEGYPEINSINTIISRIINSVKLGKIETCKENITELFNRMIETKTSIEHMREIAVFIASSLMQFLPDKFFDIESSSDNNPLVLSKILKTFNSGNLKSLLCSLAFQICSELKKSFVQNNAIISKVNDYIAQNYQKNIRLAAIANHIHVNSSYLSRLYRQETGITITDAISRYRIEKAKEFLQNPEIKAYEVAYLVGFEDAAYFSLMFKRHTGCSPTEYRQLSNRE